VLNYDLAHLIQAEYRGEAATGRLITQAERAQGPRRRGPFETLRRARQRLGVAMMRLGAGLAGRDTPVDAARGSMT
jgi:hypothetical protein